DSGRGNEAGWHREKRGSAGDEAVGCRGRQQAKRLALTQREQTRRLIDLGAGEDNGRDRAGAPVGFWMESGSGANLRAQIGRSVDQEPLLAVGGHGEARLRGRFHGRLARPREAANRTATIPLRKTTARRRTEDDGDQAHLAGEAVAR